MGRCGHGFRFLIVTRWPTPLGVHEDCCGAWGLINKAQHTGCDLLKVKTMEETSMSDAQNVCELSVETDSEGYLVDPNDWSEEIATLLAKQEGIQLGSDHWLVIRFMRT